VPFQPISKVNGRDSGKVVTADKFNRLCLSKELQKHFGPVEPLSLYLYFDHEDRRIGLSSKPADGAHIPFDFDKRGYCKASDFLEKCGIDISEQSIKFHYQGHEKDILVFQQVGIRRPRTLVQERNGNLVTP
jgi:hypothetical protein